MDTVKKFFTTILLLIMTGLCPTAVRAASPEIESAADVQLTAEGELTVGDGVTATFDEETGEVVFYSDGGTLWKDWISMSGLNKDAIKTIRAAADSGTVYLPADSSGLFSGFGSLTELDPGSFDTSNVETMSYMFSDCSALETLDLSGFNTSNVADMSGMFGGCSSLAMLDLSSFDTVMVVNASSMFNQCSSLSRFKTPKIIIIDGFVLPHTMYDAEGSAYSELPVTSESILLVSAPQFFVGDGVTATFDEETGEVVFYSDGGTLWKEWSSQIGQYYEKIKSLRVYDACGTVYLPSDSEEIFAFLKRITEMDLSQFDTSNVTNMHRMFYSDYTIETLDLSTFDTSNVTDMHEMFESCCKLTTLDLSSFDTSKVTDMNHMFFNCYDLPALDLRSFDPSGVTTMREMFRYCRSLTTLDFGSFATSNVTDMNHMFSDCMSLAALDLGSFDTSKVTDMMCMFALCESLTTLNVSSFDTSNVTDMGGMFSSNRSLTALDVSNFDTSNVTNMGAMFADIDNLPTLDLSSFDTSDVINMSRMFGDSGYTTLDLSGFDTSKVTQMYTMFSNCSGLTTLDLSSFDTSNVTDMVWMFEGCSGLTELDLSGFDTSSVTSMRGMFDGCSNLKTLDISNFDTSNVTNMKSMFDSCISLEMLDLSSFDTSKVTSSDGMFNNSSSLETLWTPGTNNIDSIGLPHTMYDSEGNAYSNLPVTSESIFLVDRSSQFIVGDGVTATFDGETGEVVFYSDGGTLWKDWISMSGLNKDAIKTIRAAADSGTVYLPADSSGLFSGFGSLTELAPGSFDTSNVETMSYMFSDCSALETLDLSGFNTSNVTDMGGMFGGCSSLAMLDLSSFDTVMVVNASSMFNQCSSLSRFKTPKIIIIDGFVLPHTMYDNAGNAYSNLPVASESILLTELPKTIVGDGVTATFDEETREVVFYSDGGTLWKDWVEKLGSNRAMIYSVNVADTSGTIYLPADSTSIFANLTNCTTLDLSHFDTSKVTDMTWMFCNGYKFTTLDISHFDTSKVTDMDYMFYDCREVKTLDVSRFDTSNVTTMNGMFGNCLKLESLDLDGFDTSNVTDMRSLFVNCSGMTELDVSSFDTSNVTDMGWMFSGCSMSELDLSGFDTSNVTDMSTMFDDSKCLTELDLSSFDTSKVMDMRQMFYGCSGLTTLDLSSFDTSNVTSMTWMFEGCSGLTELDLSGFDTSNVTDMGKMFEGCSGLTELDLSGFDTSNVTDMCDMFACCDALKSLNLSSFDTSNVTDMSGMFNRCSNLQILKTPRINNASTELPHTMYDSPRVYDPAAEGGNEYTSLPATTESVMLAVYMAGDDVAILLDEDTGEAAFYSEGGTLWKNWIVSSRLDISKIKSIKAADDSGTVYLPAAPVATFGNMPYCETINMNGFDTSNVTDMSYMFDECGSLKTVEFGNFDTSNVTNMQGMFKYSENLSQLDFSCFDTSKVTDMSSMFKGCKSLQQVDLSHFDTSSVTNMREMFADCGLTELDLGSFNTSNVTDMQYMFLNYKQDRLDVSSFDTSNATNMMGMFAGSKNLAVLDLSDFVISDTTNVSWMLGGCDNLQILKTPRINNASTELPITMYDKEGNSYDKLPVTQESILLAATPELAQEMSEVAFKSNSLILGDSIGVKFYMNLFPLTADERSAGYMTFEISGAGTCTERADFDASLTNEAGYYGFICRVNAVQMADTITATYHYGEGQTISAEYSVRRYIELFNENKDLYDQTVQDMVRALADYGHYVQLFLQDERGWTLGTGDDQYAPMDLYYAESYDLDGIRTALSGSAAVCSVDNACIRALSLSLVLDSETEIRVYVTPADGVNGDDLVFTLGGEAVTAEKTGSRYVVTIPGISAHNLGDTYTLTAQQNGETAATLQASALSYVQILLNASAYADNTNALDASASIYAYYAAAEAYKEAHTS